MCFKDVTFVEGFAKFYNKKEILKTLYILNEVYKSILSCFKVFSFLKVSGKLV